MHLQFSGRAKGLFFGCLICAIFYTYIHFQYPSLSFREIVSFDPHQQKATQEEPNHHDPAHQESQPVPSEPLSKNDFVTAATRNALATYDATSVQQFCAHNLWDSNSNVVVNCDRIFGGIGNLRQVILACLHHAMREGRGFIIPPIELRNFDDLVQLESNGDTGFKYMFDQDTFVSRLSAACPRMMIYDSLQAAQEKGHEIDHFPTTMAKYTVCEDPSSYAVNFGQFLVFPTAIYRLAYTALYSLSTTYSLPISSAPLSASFSSANTTYLALHLRTAADAIAMGWSSFEVQSQRYLELASTLPYLHIYVASGNATSVSLFSASALRLSPPRIVTTKESLLSGIDLQEMQALTWDQLALIDYIMVESAGFFAGVTESSFSWNVAAKRRALVTSPDEFCAIGADVDIPPGLVFKDEWSLIYGTDTEFKSRIWP